MGASLSTSFPGSLFLPTPWRGGRKRDPGYLVALSNLNCSNETLKHFLPRRYLQVSKGNRLSLHTCQVAHQAGAYPGFRSMKRLGVFLLPPGWDSSPSQGYPCALNSPVPIYTPVWRKAPSELSVFPNNTTQCPRPGLEPRPLAPESSALTTRPPCLSDAYRSLC